MYAPTHSFSALALLALVVPTGSANAQCIPPDQFEPNDTCATAVPIMGGTYRTTGTTGLDDDYYTFDVPAGVTVTVGAYSDDSGGWVDSELFLHAGTGTCGSLLAHSVGFFGGTQISWSNTTSSTAPVTLRLHPYTFHQPACANINLEVLGIPTACGGLPDDDIYAGNDHCAVAASIGAGYVSGLSTVTWDVDWFVVSVDADETLTVDLLFSHADVDLNCTLTVYSPGCASPFLASETSDSTTDNETVQWTNETGSTKEVHVRAIALECPTGCAEYDLSVSLDPAGTVDAFCFGDGTAAAGGSPVNCPCGNVSAAGEGCVNSHGQGAILTANGSTSVAADTLSFSIAQASHNQPCMLVQGATRTALPFKDGILCAGSPTRRMEVVFLDGTGAATTVQSIISTGAVQPGQRRIYQAWYRDPFDQVPCTARSNFSSALDVLFY